MVPIIALPSFLAAIACTNMYHPHKLSLLIYYMVSVVFIDLTVRSL
jgi:hypothetical protein